MQPLDVGIVGILALGILIMMGMPIAFSLMFVGLFGLVIIRGVGSAFDLMTYTPFSTVSQYMFTVIPLFIIMGDFAFLGRVSEDAFAVADKWVRGIPGGLAIATVAACTAFAATCGSAVATAATVGKVALPEMKKYGYSAELSTGCVAAGGCLGVLIPPSVPFVIYGAMTQESIGSLLMAGVFPGLLLALTFIVGIMLLVQVRPSLAAPREPASWKERFTFLPRMWSVSLLFLIVIGGMYVGLFTPTEAGAVGALFTFILGVARGKDRVKGFRKAFLDTTANTIMIFAIFIGAMIFSMFLSMSTIPVELSRWLVALPIPRMLLVISIMLVIYVPLGCFIDPTSMIVITVPILYPVIKALGFDGVWFGVLVVMMVNVAVLTPPLGFNVFIIKSIAGDEVSLSTVFRGVSFFLVLIAICIGLLLAFPQISLWLPQTMSKIG